MDIQQMKTIETKNAIIISTYLGFEDHDIFTCYLNLDYGDLYQSAGGYALDEYCESTKRRIWHSFGSHLIMQILKTLEIRNWEKLKGEKIRVKCDSIKVYSIGHYIKDQWVDFQQLSN